MPSCVVTGFSSTLLRMELPPQLGVAPLPLKEQGILQNASFTAYHKDSGSLYAVHETRNLSGEGITTGGGLSRWQQYRKDGPWDRRQLLPSGGHEPTHVSLYEREGLLWVANYTGGSIRVFAIDKATGALDETPIYTEAFGVGSRVEPERQERAHPHGTFFFRDLALVVDLGLDCIHIYRMGTNRRVSKLGAVELGAGYGPRHLAADLDRNRIYVLNELEPLISVFDVDAGKAAFVKRKDIAISVEDANHETRQLCSGIALSPNGRFLYVSNRGDGAVLVLEVRDADGGYLRQVQCQRLIGTWPRFFLLFPDGQTLITADQFTGKLEVFFVDVRTGLLSGGYGVSAPNNPSSIVIVE